jgi:tetratricopeptide (TPR) repeat protein
MLSSLLGEGFLLSGQVARLQPLLAQMSIDPGGHSRGYIAFWEGRWEQAESSWTEAYKRSHRVGGREEGYGHLSYLAWLRRTLGRYADAEMLLKDALSICREEPLQYVEMWAHPEFALLCAKLGRVEEATQHLARCREIIEEGEDWRIGAGRLARAEAVIAAAEEKFDVAQAEFEKAARISRFLQGSFEEAESLYCWGCALNAAGEPARAVEKLEAAANIYRDAGAGERWIERALNEKRAFRSWTAPTTHERGACFRREGDYWAISFGGTSSQLKHAKGLLYVAYLLQHPSVEFRAIDLVYAEQSPPLASKSAHLDDRGDRHDMRKDLGDAGLTLDRQARAQYRAQLIELRDELDEAKQFNDVGRTERLQAEIDFLTAELLAAFGKNGTNRKTASHAERARLAVYKRIKFSLGEIRRTNRALATHLTATIRTGYNCVYLPEQPVEWSF